MKRLLLLAALAVAGALAGCAQGPRAGEGPRFKPSANPSAVIAAELAFSQLAQSKGQWTAFLETAAPEAEMFAPQRVKAAAWLKGRANPAVPVKWQPYAVWSSCDGSYAVTRGVWQRPGSTGSFATVWQLQKNGAYKWLLDMSLATEQLAGPPEMIAAKVAECPKGAAAKALIEKVSAERVAQGAARSDDMSLIWLANAVDASSRRFIVSQWNGVGYDTVIDTGVTARGP